jgi:hypothetical protein
MFHMSIEDKNNLEYLFNKYCVIKQKPTGNVYRSVYVNLEGVELRKNIDDFAMAEKLINKYEKDIDAYDDFYKSPDFNRYDFRNDERLQDLSHLRDLLIF